MCIMILNMSLTMEIKMLETEINDVKYRIDLIKNLYICPETKVQIKKELDYYHEPLSLICIGCANKKKQLMFGTDYCSVSCKRKNEVTI